MFHPITNTRSSGANSYGHKAFEDTSKKDKVEKSYYFLTPSPSVTTHRLNKGSFSQFPSEIMGLIHDFLSNKNPNESYWRLLTEMCHLMPLLLFEGKAHDYAQHAVMSLSKRTGLSWNEILRTAQNWVSHREDSPEKNPISLFTIHDFPRLENFVKGNIEIHASTQKKILREIFPDHVKKKLELAMGENFLRQIYLDRFSIISSILYAQSMKFFSSVFNSIYNNDLKTLKINPIEHIGILILCTFPLLSALFLVYYNICLIYQDINMENIESFKRLNHFQLDMTEHRFFQEQDIQALHSIISEMIRNIPEQEREELNFWLVNSFSFQ